MSDARGVSVMKAFPPPNSWEMDIGQFARIARFFGLGGPAEKQEKPVRIGVIGASQASRTNYSWELQAPTASVGPRDSCPNDSQVATYALIWPARRLASVEILAVAARDGQRALQFAKANRYLSPKPSQLVSHLKSYSSMLVH